MTSQASIRTETITIFYDENMDIERLFERQIARHTVMDLELVSCEVKPIGEGVLADYVFTYTVTGAVVDETDRAREDAVEQMLEETFNKYSRLETELRWAFEIFEQNNDLLVMNGDGTFTVKVLGSGKYFFAGLEDMVKGVREDYGYHLVEISRHHGKVYSEVTFGILPRCEEA